MRRARRRSRGGVVALALALVAVACAGAGEPSESHAPVSGPAGPADPPALAGVHARPVPDRAGPGGTTFEVTLRSDPAPQHLERRIGQRTFEIAMRATGMTNFPCGSCHLPGGRISAEGRTPDAHDDIRADHPAEVGATCTACHTRADVTQLVLPSGATAPLDEAYRMCAQCHFSQVEDWAGGAHGKRLDGWRGRRVLLGCADCHDPHSPGLETRVPFPGPVLPTRGRHR